MTEKEPSMERLRMTARRFERYIAECIAAARTADREISDGTARLIAHVLGRRLGRASALAEFGRTGAANYMILIDEAMSIYNDAEAPATVKHWIDWLGTYVLQELRARAEAAVLPGQNPTVAEYTTPEESRASRGKIEE